MFAPFRILFFFDSEGEGIRFLEFVDYMAVEFKNLFLNLEFQFRLSLDNGELSHVDPDHIRRT